MSFFFFFNDTATTEIYTLSLHDALPIYLRSRAARSVTGVALSPKVSLRWAKRSEEHTSELQSQSNLVCRLLLEKKKNSNGGSIIRKYHSLWEDYQRVYDILHVEDEVYVT